MIARKKIIEPDELNKLANKNSLSFIQSVKAYADEGRQEEKIIEEKLIAVLNNFEHLVKLKQEEKAVKETKAIESETNYEKEIEKLKEDNKILKEKFKRTTIISVIVIISIVWWAFDYFSSTNYYHIKNYVFIKIVIQGMLITLSCAIFTKQNRTSWISGTIAFFIALITLIKT